MSSARRSCTARAWTRRTRAATALMAAAAHGKVNAIEFLLERRADLEARDRSGATALTHGVLGKRVGACAALAAKCCVDARDREGKTAFMYACSTATREVARVLLDAGAAVEATCPEGRTPLMFAARNGRHGQLQELLQRSADVARTDENGWPALLHAVAGRRPALCRALLAAGADWRADVDGTPLLAVAATLDAPLCMEVFAETVAEAAEADAEAERRKDPRYGRAFFAGF